MNLSECEVEIFPAVEASYVFDDKEGNHEIKQIGSAVVATVDDEDLLSVIVAVYAMDYKGATAHQWLETDGKYRLLMPGFNDNGAKRFMRKVIAFIKENNIGFRKGDN